MKSFLRQNLSEMIHLIDGLQGYHLDMQTHIPLDQSKVHHLIATGDTQQVKFDGFSVRGILVLRCVCACVRACVCVSCWVDLWVGE